MNNKKNKDFFNKVYQIVEQIPYGKVTTYGLIAQRAGLKSSARMVGWALNAYAYSTALPCHRVVNRNGELTGKNYFGTPTMMRELLESEGVQFIDDRVDLKRFLWTPEEVL
ncbi:MAG: MGMT family protein [Candidatus Kapabacteria bacterium]|nr:MGMT family protein [Candidatus Kapabacteria bacterium]